MKQRSPVFLPVWQLILFSVLSLGTFLVYWYYKTWKFLRDSGNEKISPGWRTFGMLIPIVNFFVSYRFFCKIHDKSKLKTPSEFLAALFGLAPLIGNMIPLGALVIFIPLGIAQHALNAMERPEKLQWKRDEVIACTLLTIFLSPLFALGVMIGLRTFLISPFQMDGNSMKETLHDKDYMLVDKMAYKRSDPKRGDIVVFTPPSDPQSKYLKRIVGLPGETLVIRDGFVYIKKGTTETKLNETYLNERSQGHTFRHPPSSGDTSEIRYDIPAGQYFVLGDFRQGSLDSRSFQDPEDIAIPYVAREALIGKVISVVLPFEDAKPLSQPDYQLELR